MKQTSELTHTQRICLVSKSQTTKSNHQHRHTFDLQSTALYVVPTTLVHQHVRRCGVFVLPEAAAGTSGSIPPHAEESLMNETSHFYILQWLLPVTEHTALQKLHISFWKCHFKYM